MKEGFNVYSLVLDSSTNKIYIGLVKDNIIVEEKYILGFNNHSKNLVYNIDLIFKNNNIKINQLNEVICGIGPGSYTGCKLALTVSKMLAYFLDIKLKSISTLTLMKSGYKNINVLSLIDAKRGYYFFNLTNNENIIINDTYSNTLPKNYDYVVDIDNMNVDPVFCIKNSTIVDKLLICPNYIKDAI